MIFLKSIIFQNLMFKQVIVLAMIGIIAIEGTMKVNLPKCAADRLPNVIPYTLSNFGVIPYGQTILGQIYIPKNDVLCSTKGESFIKKKANQASKIILLVKRGQCKFTEKVIAAQNLGADMAIIYDYQGGDSVNLVMKNDGQGHLAEIPSMLISNTNGLKLGNTSKDCQELPFLKIEFELQQRQKSDVILWLDANNRETYILVSQFYKNNYYKSIENKINLSIRFKIQTTCNSLFCSENDCVGSKVFGQKYCRATDKEHPLSPTGIQIINEQLREHFLWESLKKSNLDKILWWKYMNQFDKQVCLQKEHVRDCSYTKMSSVGIPNSMIQQIKQNINQTLQNVKNEKSSILQTNSMESRELNIYFYPQATINNRNYYGLFKAPQVFEMICDSLLTPPKECITFIKSRELVKTSDDNEGVWKTVLLTLFIMTFGFIVALLVYTRIIRREVDTQLSIEVNKMVENYVDLAHSKKNVGNSYSKFEQQK